MYRMRFSLWCVVVLCLNARPAAAGPIYVYTESDGVIRFSSGPPPHGENARVFTARDSKFSYYSGRGYRRGRWGGGLFKEKFHNIIAQASGRYRVGTELIKAVIHVESAFNPYAVSPRGALGLMQLMPDNVRLLGVRDPFSPHENIYGGAKLLAMLTQRFGGNLKLVLAAYNAGAGAVEKYGGIPPYAETQDYVGRVLDMKGKYQKTLYE
jgi:soluble lytic murein transglycosylase-like protein